jgi:hypothetical protein
MNYEKHYNLLIERARNRILEGYQERHHVIPRCTGGSDDAENIISLTAEEHYIAHQLLVKIYPSESKLVYAAKMMTTNKYGHRKNNRLYGWLRRKFAEARSEAMTGNVISEEQKIKISASNRGKKRTPEAREKMRKAKENYIPWNAGLAGTGVCKATKGSFKRGQKPWNADGTPAYEYPIEINNVIYKSRKEAARMLDKDITTIFRWLKNGKAIDRRVA